MGTCIEKFLIHLLQSLILLGISDDFRLSAQAFNSPKQLIHSPKHPLIIPFGDY